VTAARATSDRMLLTVEADWPFHLKTETNSLVSAKLGFMVHCSYSRSDRTIQPNIRIFEPNRIRWAPP